MTTLTASSTINIGDGTTATETVSIPILPGAAPGTGLGRLIHPTLGTLDYDHPPDEWVNVDTDVIIEPIWSTEKALIGSINALWQGDITDVQVQERWTGEVNTTLTFLRQLLSFWQTPPDPVNDAPIQWYPSYTNNLGYNVIILKVEVGAGLSGVVSSRRTRGVTLNAYQFGPGEWITEPVTVAYQILGRV